MTELHKNIEQEIRTWLEEVVIGLNLCPFAARPYAQERVRIVISEACTDEAILTDLQMALLQIDSEAEVETSLLVLAKGLTDFDEYNQFLEQVDFLLEQQNWLGQYQVASFHPDYQFADTWADDAENLTNRSPYPILHIISEVSLEQALEHYDKPENIPEQNIKTMQNLTEEEKKRLFSYLFTASNGSSGLSSCRT